MAWKIEIHSDAQRDMDKLDAQIAQHILRFLDQRVARLENPRSVGEPLTGPELGHLWRYRVGDYRILCDIRDKQVVVLVIHIGHRREVYR
ncbi:MAG TPA: type II toxin-antitoxin system RelE/ParE family toxin [Acidobacteriaceae bacterium]|jgi:mRNA interferase RelE/StbE|nr:type II toxin-antitoxin system RelE/ParE family toxin [Acidobacteriaceae bacterium]